MPQFDPTSFPSQIFWLVVFFAGLFFFLSKVAIPRLQEVMEQRDKMIDDDLEAAAKLKAETDAAIAAYEKALDDARSAAHARIKEVTEAASAAAEKKTAEVNARLAEQIKSGEAKIAAAKDSALAGVRDVATSVASATVEKLTGISVDEAKAAAAVDAALQE
ncbi:MAG: F0F1 ATP synthase subunit B' [Rhodospirillaceae bacterium]